MITQFRAVLHFLALLAILPTAGFGADAQPTPSAGTITVTDKVRHEFKGWGLTPAPYDRQMPTYAPGKVGEKPSPGYGEAGWLPKQGSEPGPLHRAVCDLGFEIARVYLSPTLCATNGALVSARMQDFKDHLALLAKGGVKQYAVTAWSPPEHMKLPDRVRWGKIGERRQYLNPAFAGAYAEFYVAALKDVRAAGFPAPVSVSIQNEPGTAQPYDGCVYTDTPEQRATYRQVVKALRRELDASGFKSVPIIIPETESLVDITKFLGQPGTNGFAEMQRDTEFARAVGGFAWHTYSTAGNTKELLAAMSAYPGRDRWMTEYSTFFGIRPEHRAKSGHNELDWTLNFARRMGGDIVDQGCHYWCFWRGWHSSGAADDQHLLYGDAKKAKAYFFFQQLWQTVRGGWRVMEVNADGLGLRADNGLLIAKGHGDQWSAPVDILAFTSPDNTRVCLVLVNARTEPLAISSIRGLCGARAEVFLTTKELDMAAQPAPALEAGALSSPLRLPPWSVTLIRTQPDRQTNSSASAKLGAPLIWTGQGEDDKWSTAANWQPARVPSAADAVVIDGASAKNCRWDGEQHIASLTVTPAYKGQLIFAGHGAIDGDVVLSGRVHSNRDMHQWLWMRGQRVDLSGVTEWTQAHRYSGGIDLGGTDEKLVQTFTAPRMRIGDLRMYEKGTVVFAGPVIAALVEAGPGKVIDFNHQNLTARSLGCAAQVKNLGGVNITLTSWAGWSPFCFGRSKSYMPKDAPLIDLAPDKPWKLIVKNEEIEAYSDAAKRQPFAFINCRIGNCDVSGGAVVTATDRCTDAGGNRNIIFK